MINILGIYTLKAINKEFGFQNVRKFQNRLYIML